MKNYLAEGIVNEHKVLVVDPDEYREREHWLKYLPAVYKIKEAPSSNGSTSASSESSFEEEKRGGDSLKVAWRYKNLLSDEQQNGTSKL